MLDIFMCFRSLTTLIDVFCVSFEQNGRNFQDDINKCIFLWFFSQFDSIKIFPDGPAGNEIFCFQQLPGPISRHAIT